MNRTPVISRRNLAIVVSPLLAMALAAVVAGNQAAGIVAAAFTLIMWAAIDKFTRITDPPAVQDLPQRRPVFVGPTPLPEREQWKDPELAERVSRVAADPRAPAGERAAARAALRRLQVQ